MRADLLCIFAGVYNVRRIAACADDDKHVVRLHEVAQLMAEHLVERDIVSDGRHLGDVIAHGENAEAPPVAARGVLAEIADEVVRRRGAAAVSGDEHLAVIAVCVQQDADAMIEHDRVDSANLRDQFLLVAFRQREHAAFSFLSVQLIR